jgi:hypothetical protein
MANFKMPIARCSAKGKALNLDVSQITRIVMDVGIAGPPRGRVSMYLSAEQEDALVRIFEATEFEEKADATTEAA